jgi:hypothetical protein
MNAPTPAHECGATSKSPREEPLLSSESRPAALLGPCHVCQQEPPLIVCPHPCFDRLQAQSLIKVNVE